MKKPFEDNKSVCRGQIDSFEDTSRTSSGPFQNKARKGTSEREDLETLQKRREYKTHIQETRNWQEN